MENSAGMNIEESTIGMVYKWKAPAKCVAYFDLFAELVALLAVFLRVSYLLFKVETKIFKLTEVYLIIGAVSAIILLLSICITSLLIKATQEETSCKTAQKKASIWLGINIVLLIFAVNGFISIRGWLLLLVTLIVRGAFMLIVGQFIGELNKAVAVKEWCLTAV